MSNSNSLPPFTYDVLRYFNRDQLERFAIVCYSLKNLIERYLSSHPYRVFDRLWIRGGSYALEHNDVEWNPNQDYYSAQQFLDGQTRNTGNEYYSFSNMHPYLVPTIRIKRTCTFVGEDSTYSPEHITEMESIAYLWSNDEISICNAKGYGEVVAKDFQLILNSPTILQCRILEISNAHFSFKDYKVLYSVKFFEILYHRDADIDSNCWTEFLEQPEIKPFVVLNNICNQKSNVVLDRLKESFISSVSPNAFKIVFAQNDEPLIEFKETNKNSGEKLELKKDFRLSTKTSI